VSLNEAFKGLPKDEAFSLTNYSHFRNVQQKDKKEGIEKDDCIFQKNFLDSLVPDQPNGCWSIQKDSTGTVAVIRNLLWPGHYTYHKVGTRIYGSVYIGEGLKNAELPFML
jgi:radial spoke head protein 9